LLALLIPCLHRNTYVGSSGVDRASVIPAKEFALFRTRDNQAFAILFQLRHQIVVGKIPCVFADVSSRKVWLPENVQVVGFDDQLPATGSALVTFHRGSVSEQLPLRWNLVHLCRTVWTFPQIIVGIPFWISLETRKALCDRFGQRVRRRIAVSTGDGFFWR